MKQLQQTLLLLALVASMAISKDEEKAAGTGGKTNDSAVLQDSGAGKDGPELLAYLNRQIPSANLDKRLKLLVAQLGSGRYLERQQAEEELRLLGLPAESAVRDAQKTDDLEIAYRVNRIISLYGYAHSKELFSALKQLEKQRPDNAVVTLLGIAPFCEKAYLQRQLHKTLLAVVRPEDQDALKRNAADGHVLTREAAIKGLGQALKPEEAEDYLPSFLKDPDSRMQLVATIELINDGRRDSIGHLLTLLEDEREDIRKDTAITLNHLTGQRFTYDWSAAKDTRAPGVAAWRNWVNKEAPSAELAIPILLRTISLLDGKTLIADTGSDKVILLDPSDKKVWEYDCDAPAYAELLPNGNFLIAGDGSNKLEEVTLDKKVVWSMPIRAIRARRLANGNVLIADYWGKRAVEVKRKTKEIIWKHPVPGACRDVQRLANGNTLIAFDGGSVEVTRAGKEVWRGPKMLLAASAERLENGNTLISDGIEYRVIELNVDGDIVWEFNTEESLLNAWRMENGNTLISLINRTIELSPTKEIVWERKHTPSGLGSTLKE